MLKISLPGKDVKTASPEELAVDSTYDTLKLIIRNSNPYFGEILVTFNTNPPNGVHNIFTFSHGLGKYTPFYYMFFDLSKSSNTLSPNTGQDTATQFDTSALGSSYFKVTDTDSGFSFDFVVVDSTRVDMTDRYESFKYFVFVNDGT